MVTRTRVNLMLHQYYLSCLHCLTDITHILFSPVIFPHNLVVRRAASDASRKLATSYLLTYVRCATFGPTHKPVILIDCQFYGMELRQASGLIYYLHIKLLHYGTA
jgi:hypothetical protein